LYIIVPNYGSVCASGSGNERRTLFPQQLSLNQSTHKVIKDPECAGYAAV